jgi:hypothetical protein
MVNAMPQTMAVAADKIVEAQDWPGADEIAKRLRSQLPPGMVAETDLTEEEQRAAQQQQAVAEQQQQLQKIAFELEVASKQAEIEAQKAKAVESQARAREALARATLAEAQAAAEIAGIETERVQTAVAIADSLEMSATNGAKQRK